MNSYNEEMQPTEQIFTPAPLWRRLLAVLYDTLIIICIVFIAWQPVPLLPDDNWPDVLSKGIRLSYLVAITFAFLGWFWTHGGQTIGMRAWNIKLIAADSTIERSLRTTWSQAWLRYCIAMVSWAVAGAGFLWSLLDSERRTWHDLGSSTRLIVERESLKKS